MKPKIIKCPICGKEMIPVNWGKKRGIMRDAIGAIPLLVKNYAHYECDCGCTIDYSGDLDCWAHACQCKSCSRHY